MTDKEDELRHLNEYKEIAISQGKLDALKKLDHECDIKNQELIEIRTKQLATNFELEGRPNYHSKTRDIIVENNAIARENNINEYEEQTEELLGLNKEPEPPEQKPIKEEKEITVSDDDFIKHLKTKGYFSDNKDFTKGRELEK